jgi:hypothetical protein
MVLSTVSERFKNHQYLRLLMFAALAACFCCELIGNLYNWGARDWDQFIFWNAVQRETILTHHQFPLWNPYINGGNVLLAHPHSSFLSPFFIFVLIFGPVAGLKIQVIIHLIIGMWGMFLLLRYIKIDEISSYVSSFVYMLSSVYFLHIAEGHMEWLPMAFLPWLFLCYLKSLSQKRHIITAIILLALILLAGTVNVFSIALFILFIYSVFLAIQKNSIVPVKNIFFIFIGTFLLCSAKLLPMLEFLYKYPRFTIEQDGIGLRVLYMALLSQRQALFDLLSLMQGEQALGLKYRWHEYGAYIGMLPLALSLLGIIFSFKKNWPLILTAIFALLVTLGYGSPVNLWKGLHYLPVYNSLHVPSRFMFGFIFCISILTGIGMLYFWKFLQKTSLIKSEFLKKIIFMNVALFILFDLYTTNAIILKNSYWMKPKKIERNKTFAQRYWNMDTNNEYFHSNAYPVFLSNSGVINGYEVMQINKGDVAVASSPTYRGEAYLVNNEGSASITEFSPNRIVVDVYAKQKDLLVLNQNYYTGWSVKGNRRGRAKNFKGLISHPVNPGHQQIIFYYLPVSFILGILVSSVTFIILIGILCYRRGGATIQSFFTRIPLILKKSPLK